MPSNLYDDASAGVIAALIRDAKPQSVLETGSDFTRAIAAALADNGTGHLTTLENDAAVAAALAESFKEKALRNVEVKHGGGERFGSGRRYDFAVFNGPYSAVAFDDAEAEFSHAEHFLSDGAGVVFMDCRHGMPRLNNLPEKLEAMGLLSGMYVDTPRGLYAGTYRRVTRNSPKRLVFCLSAGRSGTAFLTSLLYGAPGMVALHEPEPKYQWQTLRLQQDLKQAERFVREVKRPWIEALPGDSYVELSHYVHKGFMEAWLAEGARPDVIVLHREPRRIAQSRYAMGIDFFARPETPLQHMMHPADKRPLHLALPGWETLNNYQLCYWFALESDARSQHYLTLLTKQYGAKSFITSLESLSDGKGDEIFKLYAWLGIALEKTDIALLRERQRTRVNTRDQFKKPQRVESLKTLDFDALEKEVRQRCGLD